MMHDCVITARFLVVCPARFDLASQPILQWVPERGTRIAIIARDGSAPTRWIAADAFWVSHFANAFDETDDRCGTTTVVDYARWSHPAIGDTTSPATGSVARATGSPSFHTSTIA